VGRPRLPQIDCLSLRLVASPDTGLYNRLVAQIRCDHLRLCPRVCLDIPVTLGLSSSPLVRKP
jgi:hypothetical protein